MFEPELISPHAIEARLRGLRRSAADPVHGFFGPESQVWRVNRESAIFLGAGCALLLQLAHPAVAQAIGDHSPVRHDPFGRYLRTMRPVFTMVFGTVDQALAQARAIYRIHERISGALPARVGEFPEGYIYRAVDARAALWVYATLFHTALRCYELVLPPLTGAERDCFYGEGRRFAALFGIPDALLPADWRAFEVYMRKMTQSGALAAGPAGRGVADYFFARRRRSFGRFVPGWYKAVTAQLLPKRLRDGFGLAYGPREQASARRALDCIGAVYPRLPGALRHVGPYLEAAGRVAGKPHPGPWTRVTGMLWTGRPRMAP